MSQSTTGVWNNFSSLITFDTIVQAAMKDKELIENSRLRERTGGYHKYVDAAEVHNPDPTSSHFISEQERFDKDFSVADQRVRQQQF